MTAKPALAIATSRPPKVALGDGDGLLDRAVARDVHLDGDDAHARAQLGRQGVEPLAAARREHEVRAVRRQLARDGGADAARRARDEDGLALEHRRRSPSGRLEGFEIGAQAIVGEAVALAADVEVQQHHAQHGQRQEDHRHEIAEAASSTKSAELGTSMLRDELGEPAQDGERR